jgi:hypothetical protein
MKLRGPYLTMVAGVAAAAVIGLMSANATDAATEKLQQAAADQANNAGADPAKTTPPAEPTEPAETTPPAEPNNAANRKAVYAGRVDGGAATIAVSVKGDKAIAYICDGKRVEQWLSGTVAGNQVTLAGTGNASLNAEITGNRLAGTVNAKRKNWTFDIKTVKKPSGLYQAAANVRGAEVVGSWIVLENGEQVGVVSTDGEPGPAQAFDTNTGTVEVEGGSLIVLPVGPGGP